MKRPRGTGSTYLRGKTWWLAYYRQGEEIRESSESTKREAAERLLRRRLGDIESGRPVAPRADRVTVGELLADYLADAQVRKIRSLGHSMARARRLRIAFGRRRAQSITSADIRQYILMREKRTAAPATINRELAVLRRAFRLGIEGERVHRAPVIRALPEKNVRAGFFDYEAFQSVRNAMRKEVARDISTLGYWTGWRLGELLKLEVRQVDVKQHAIVLEPGKTKGGEGRIVFLEGESWEIVEKWYRRRVVGNTVVRSLFHRAGKPVRSIREAWTRACTKAGHPGMLFHDLRRSAIRNMLRAGIQERVAMKISGHRTRSVFDRYNIVNEDDLKAAALKLSQESPTKTPTTTKKEKRGA